MLYKKRIKAIDFILLEHLARRLPLSASDQQYFSSLQKGYAGECQFDTLTDKLPSECLVLNDLLLQENRRSFQLDSLIITPEKIYLYEVKNFEGNFYYENDTFYREPRREVNNPLHQLSRSESLLRQMILRLGYNIPVEANVVFINPAFMLYQASHTLPFIYPNQVDNHLSRLKANSTKLTARHKKLADTLVASHIADSPFNKIPTYHFSSLRKGITCATCFSFSLRLTGKRLLCTACGHAELVSDAVIRTAVEFKLLFPDEKITTNIIHEWCKIIPQKRRIRYYLKQHFNSQGVRQWRYYD